VQLAATLVLIALAVMLCIQVLQGRAMRRELGRLQREVTAAHKSTLRANLFAESAVRTAEAAERIAGEARDLADIPVMPRRRTSPSGSSTPAS
jgi:hypothetical protein